MPSLPDGRAIAVLMSTALAVMSIVAPSVATDAVAEGAAPPLLALNVPPAVSPSTAPLSAVISGVANVRSPPVPGWPYTV